MKLNLLTALSVSLIFCIAPPTALLCQDNSTKQSQDAEPVYSIGGGVTPPHQTYGPEPEYDDASRKAKVQGVVVVSMIVTKEGRTRDVTVTRSLSKNLDQQAIKAILQWRFDPATKDGTPVAVKIVVETSFHLK
jgi:TonB family protein